MCGRKPLSQPADFRGRLAPVIHLFIAPLGTLIEVAQAGSFHGRDVHKHVLAAVVGLNKSKSLSRIEPLHNTCRHVTLSLRNTIVAVKGVKRGLRKAKAVGVNRRPHLSSPSPTELFLLRDMLTDAPME